jgi:hypothetical protein
MQRTRAREKSRARTNRDEGQRQSGRTPKPAPNLRSVAVIVPVLAHGEGRCATRIGVHRPEEERAGESGAEKERGGTREGPFNP